MRKPVVGWEGFYEVSSAGEVFSVARRTVRADGSVQTWVGKQMKARKNTQGYLHVRLSRPGRRIMARVHRLVAEAFITNPNLLPEVNHLDGRRDNPKAANLEWCTPSQNRKHAYSVLKSITMPRTGKLSMDLAEVIRSEHVPGIHGCKRLGRKYGVDESCIRAIVNMRAYIPSPPDATKETAA